MILPPILELYVVWHPGDKELGEWTVRSLIEHFHGPAYSGLAGGAVEVYSRSQGWQTDDDAPRPIPAMEPLPAELPEPQLTAVLPIIGYHLAEAIERDGVWRDYLAHLVDVGGESADGASTENVVGIYALPEPDLRVSDYVLHHMTRRMQWLPPAAAGDARLLARELAQKMTQDLRQSPSPDDPPEHRVVQIFVSHTKESSDAERGLDRDGIEVERGPRTDVVDTVRRVIRNSHLEEFFDAHDIQIQSDWAAILDQEASRSAMLMVRTDLYSSREWTQREVLTAKHHDLPIVALFAASGGDERGSFLMDHVPIFPCDPTAPDASIEKALARLVDESLKRALWRRQSVYLGKDGFDWMPCHAPELVTLLPWLARRRVEQVEDDHVWILHPDPPLGPNEFALVKDLCRLAGFDKAVDVLTPRTFAGRAGSLPS